MKLTYYTAPYGRIIFGFKSNKVTFETPHSIAKEFRVQKAGLGIPIRPAFRPVIEI